MTQLEAHIEAFRKEFPWFLNYIDPERIESLKVSRVSDSLLTSIPIKYVWLDEYPSPDNHVFLVDAEGKPLAHVGYEDLRLDPTCRYRAYTGLLWWKKRDYGNGDLKERVSKAWHKLGHDMNNVKYVLSLNAKHCRHWRDQVFDVIVHKLPHGFNLDNWIEELQRKAENIVRTEIDEVDSKLN